MSRTRSVLFLIALAVLSAIAFSGVSAGTKSYVGTKTVGGPSVSMDDIDHSSWDTLLKKYVDQDGMVNYRAWKATTTDRDRLTDYLSTLSSANPQLPADADAKLAFWINAYNAVTVSGILREYPTSSIRNHTAKVFGYNIWKDYQLYVNTKAYSLDAMEHQVLRKMSDPRIHFAIVCASIGCPRLLNEAYMPNRLQSQLEINAKDFFGRDQNFRHDLDRQRFELSSILSWFGEDFGSDPKAQLRRIGPWLPTSAARKAANQGVVSVSFQDYNWNLNEQP